MAVLLVRIAFAVATSAAFCVGAKEAGLPSVDSVLTKANSKAQDFAQQAASMQQKLEAQQKQSRATLDNQKKEYERLLHAQKEQSEAISRRNVELRAGNDKLSRMNTELTADLKKLSERNGQMRTTLEGIGSKVAAAREFLADSLKLTDDSDAKELAVLIPSTPKPTLDNFLAATNGHSLSLLEVNSKRGSEGPEGIVSLLAASLSEIAEAEKEGVAELKAHFLDNFGAGEKHQAQLNETQAALMQTNWDLQDRRARLLEAKAHLEATGKELIERLRAVDTFANTVDAAVVSSLRPQASGTDKMAASASIQSDKLKRTAVSNPIRPRAGTNISALVQVSAATGAMTKKQSDARNTTLSEPRVQAAAKSSSLRKLAVKKVPHGPLDVMDQMFSLR